MIRIRRATIEDNEQLIALTSSSPMRGSISLRIDRKPDFFRLLNERGKSSVWVAEKNARIAGCISISKQRVYINGEIQNVFYVADLKVNDAFRGSYISFKLIDELKNFVMDEGADLIFCTAAEGNDAVVPFFNGRLNIPRFQLAGSFNVFQFIAFKKKIRSNELMASEIALSDELLQFLNDHYCNVQFGAVICERQVSSTINIGVRAPSGKLLGVMCVVDTLSYKQNVVVGLPSSLKWLMRLAKPVGPLFGMSQFPELGEPVRMLYAKYFVAKNRDIAQGLIKLGRNLVHDKNYSFLALALHDKDTVTDYVKRFPKFNFRSHGWITSLKNNQSIIDSVRSGIIYEDYSLV